jgi:hypothetical protein
MPKQRLSERHFESICPYPAGILGIPSVRQSSGHDEIANELRS